MTEPVKLLNPIDILEAERNMAGDGLRLAKSLLIGLQVPKTPTADDINILVRVNEKLSEVNSGLDQIVKLLKGESP